MSASNWTFEPGVTLAIGLLAGTYVWGLARLWRTAGVGQGITRAEAGAFAAGWATLVVALMSPVDALSDVRFWVHMVQHELLMLVAAPLLAASAPMIALIWMWPAGARRRIATVIFRRPVTTTWAFITAPATVWLAHGLALWIWHLPSLMDAALANEWVHGAQHLCFFGTALLFWWGITHGRYGRLGYGAAIVYVFATALHSSVLGALLTFSAHVWYPAYAATASAAGLTPLEDQQVAGLVMWVPASVVFLAVGLLLLAAWLRESERRARLVSSLGIIACAVAAGIAASACSSEAFSTAKAHTGGDPSRGMAAIHYYGCDTCHTIPGVHSAQGQVGPPLTAMGSRAYIAGLLPNTPANMQAWIRHPRAIEPHTAMPDLGVTDRDARDISAYLYTLR